ncbi:AbiJ-related protein [Streptomyces microflavus]|uniref:AbiJ-related protein n=1 Tax=Streptomyces microflavus TaxID=1919 RepID=UPI0038265953
MVGSRGRPALRTLLESAVAVLGNLTHTVLSRTFDDLGMPQIPESAGSKAVRIDISLQQIPDPALPGLAARILDQQDFPFPVRPPLRHQLEDILWEAGAHPAIPKKTRRELARALYLPELAGHNDRFLGLLERLWVIESDLSFDEASNFLLSGMRPVSLKDLIERHVLRNKEDWSTEYLFEKLGAFEAGDARFARFLEGLVSADVLLDEHLQVKTAGTINAHLRVHGIELRQTSSDGGYPLFTLVSTRLHSSRKPKNIIFASLGKPDIRFRSSVDNDIEIVGGERGHTLVYDREIPAEGLRWRDLHSWWQDTYGREGDSDPGEALYQRLLKSLPKNSPGQKNLFEAYRTAHPFSADDLALLPEVWLHWDPRTVKERGPEALLRSRMDFLMLLPFGQRVVLEVDGVQHYTRDHGHTPDTAKYADMVAADRDLKLREYEVFRFGHDELKQPQDAKKVLLQFMPTMLDRFKANL